MTGSHSGATETTNVLVCGVGGQGVILFSNVLSNLALDAGLDCKKSEVHGMAQRGGSVTSHIRFGPKVHSPLIEEGTAGTVVAFERLEALRYAHYVAPSGRLLYDPHRIQPLPVQIGAAEPMPDEEVDRRLRARAGMLVPVPAFATAVEMGNPRVQNILMLGAVSHFLKFELSAYTAAIKSMVKPAFIDLNLRAFEAGRGLVCAAV